MPLAVGLSIQCEPSPCPLPFLEGGEFGDTPNPGRGLAALCTPAQESDRYMFITTFAHTNTKPHPRRDGVVPAVPPFFPDAASGRLSGTTPYGEMPWALVTAPVPALPTAREGFGARLPSPFAVCAGAGFHHTRLSVAPLEGYSSRSQPLPNQASRGKREMSNGDLLLGASEGVWTTLTRPFQSRRLLSL